LLILFFNFVHVSHTFVTQIGHTFSGLWAGWSGVRDSVRAENFSPHSRAQTGSGAHPAPYPMDTGISSPGGRAARAWSWPLTSI